MPPAKTDLLRIRNSLLFLWLVRRLLASLQNSTKPWPMLILLILSLQSALSPPESCWVNPLPEQMQILRDESTVCWWSWLQSNLLPQQGRAGAAFGDSPQSDGLSQLWNHRVSLPFFTPAWASPEHKAQILLGIYYGWEMERAQKCVFTQILVRSQLGNSHKLLRKSAAAFS